MKLYVPFLAAFLVAKLSAADIPKAFAGLFEPDIPVKGHIGMVLPPPEIDTYIEKAARKDPKWFRDFFNQTKPGEPFPYDERLGLTKEEYAEYLVLMKKRDFQPMQEVMLLLRQSSGNTWTLTATGDASPLSTLRYLGKEDKFRSPNGDLERIKDIQAEASGLLVAWNGQEWAFEEDTGLGKTKENIAIGRFVDNKNGIIVYHVQEISTKGTRLLDKALVVRFALGKAGQLTKPAPAKPAKPDSGKTTKPAPKK